MLRQGCAAIVAELTDLIVSLDSAESAIAAGLQEVVDRGARHVPGCQYAGITFARRTKSIANVTATHRYPMVLDAIQNRCGEGPCVEAARGQQVVCVDDLQVEHRWPGYRRLALAETPIRSILSCGLTVDGTPAALNFYADPPQAFTADSAEFGGMLATQVALAWSMLRRQDQFRRALASRDLIGQAKGVLMERFGLDAGAAFELLTRVSQRSNVRVAEVAEALISGERPAKRQEP